MWPFKKKEKRSRDLSEVWEGELEIEIIGVGTKQFVFDQDTLAFHVCIVKAALGDGWSFIDNVRKSPWEIVSFDRKQGKLVVATV